jgi:hypothetical protein
MKQVDFSKLPKSGRDDFALLDQFIAAGWTPVVNANDIHFGRVTVENPPNHGITFYKGTIHVWQCRNGYQVADLVPDPDNQPHGHMYINHRAYINYKTPGTRSERFDQGWIPDLKTILELDKINDL